MPSGSDVKAWANGAKSKAVAGAIKWAGKVGFTASRASLANKPGIADPDKLAGWLKAQARKRGQLAAAHR